MITEASTPRPGAAKGVVPKKGIGIVFWIDGVPGIADEPDQVLAKLDPQNELNALRSARVKGH